MTSNTCDDVVVPAGGEGNCTITNVKQGSITIVKDADPNDCQDFLFAFTGKPNFNLDDNADVQDCQDTDQPQSQTFNNLTAVSPNNVYTSTETLPNQFWQFNGVTCVNTQDRTPYTNVVNVANGVTITLNPGAYVTCTFNNEKLSPTRTQGFWQTHTAFTSQIAGTIVGGLKIGDAALHKGGTGGGGSLSNNQSAGGSELFGAFFSNIAKKSTGKGNAAQRTDIDKARMQLLQQLVAAKLNCAAFGCSANVQAMITAADAAYAGSNKATILASASAMDAYNNSGDTIIIGNAGSATPQTSKLWANLLFWDTP